MSVAAKLGPWPASVKERDWVVRAFAEYQQAIRHGQMQFLCAATPGAGKTRFGLLVLHSLYTSGLVERIVIVVPTNHLKTQWMTAASALGIPLAHEFRNGDDEVADFVGHVVTYAQVAANTEFHRRLCLRPTLVILDEPHHMGDPESGGWGEAIRYAFEAGRYHLLLTGTPFRTDRQLIAFTRTDPDTGLCVVDSGYSYGQALNAGDVRDAFFPGFDGTAEWHSLDGEHSAQVSDDLDRPTRRAVRRTIFDDEMEWLPEFIRAADHRLQEIRRDVFPQAGGLIVAIDQAHARRIVRLVERITGVRPDLAVSDLPDASRIISAFAASDRPWIVAVKMISEGVDIPRLCVGVYATTITTELYLLQFIGRFVRLIPEAEGLASHIYIPEEPQLVEWVSKLRAERDAEPVRGPKRPKVPWDRPEKDEWDWPPVQDDFFVPIRANGTQGNVIFSDGVMVTPSEIAYAAWRKAQAGLADNPGVNTELLARILRGEPRAAPSPEPERQDREEPEPVPVAVLHRRLRKLAEQLVNRLAARTGADQRDINYDLKRRLGVSPLQSTIAQLEKRIEILKEWLNERTG